jgi:hypothetical protein
MVKKRTLRGRVEEEGVWGKSKKNKKQKKNDI